MTGRRLAVVTPWFGAALSGGAERLAFQVAVAMQARGHHVEVFATCGKSFQSSWSKNAYTPGTTLEEGVTTHRFLLDERDAERFERANAVLLAMPRSSLVPEAARVSPAIEEAFVEDGIRSRALEAAIAARHAEFDRVLFVPYLYGPTLFGLEHAGDRTAMQPCLHDEAYAYLPRVARPLHLASRLLLNSEAERDLAGRIFGPAAYAKGAVTGHWIEVPPHGHIGASPFRRRVGSRYLLYLGRRDRSKNVQLLLRAFQDFRRYNRGSRLRLVLAGPGVTSFDAPQDQVHDLGFIRDAEKWPLIHGARAIVQPSQNESFSRTMVEAWALSRPVIVHARCAATSTAVRHSGGGLTAATRADWTQAIEHIDAADAATSVSFGEAGHRYFLEHASAGAIADRYETLLFGDVAGERRHAPRAEPAQNDDAFDDAVRHHTPYDVTWWDRAPDVETMHRLADGRRRILYAGHAIGTADACHELLAAFAYVLSFGVNATLSILGTVGDLETRAELCALIERHGLGGRVDLQETPTAAVAQSYFRSSHLYVSLADRPSSLVALADARALRLPVIAFAGRGVRRVLRTAGLQLARKDQVLHLAALIKLALHDDTLRADMLGPAGESLA